jgi:ketosteroid isomerase-like protein
MKKNNVLIILSVVFSVLYISCSSKNKESKESVNAYTPVSQELFAEIVHMDSVLFDAFNAHDIEKLKIVFSDSLEFYHDKGGLTGYAQSMENFKDLFERNKTTGLKRDLVKGSMEVYPIKDYGAVETGLHTFCHQENGKQDCGTFKFMHLWQKKDGQWKITRVVSYDH